MPIVVRHHRIYNNIHTFLLHRRQTIELLHCQAKCPLLPQLWHFAPEAGIGHWKPRWPSRPHLLQMCFWPSKFVLAIQASATRTHTHISIEFITHVWHILVHVSYQNIQKPGKFHNSKKWISLPHSINIELHFEILPVCDSCHEQYCLLPWDAHFLFL